MTKTSAGGRTIDLESLTAILNPAIFMILLGGLLLKFDTVTLIVVGVVGYGIWGVLNLIVRRSKQREYALQMAAKKKKKGNVQAPKLVDLGLIASFLNPVILIVLFVGVLQGWDLYMLIAIGVVGYGAWMILTMMDRKQKQVSTKKRKR